MKIYFSRLIKEKIFNKNAHDTQPRSSRHDSRVTTIFWEALQLTLFYLYCSDSTGINLNFLQFKINKYFIKNRRKKISQSSPFAVMREQSLSLSLDSSHLKNCSDQVNSCTRDWRLSA